MPFLQGLAFGLGTALFVGPVFFTLLKNTIQYGKRAGYAVAVGIFTSDVCVLLISLLFAKAFLQDIMDHSYSTKVYSLLLLLFSILFFVTKVNTSDSNAKLSTGKIWSSFIQGFLVNFVNPFVFVIWMGFIAIAEKYDNSSQLLFYGGILLGILSTDLLKVLMSNKIKSFIKDQWLSTFYTILGLVLLSFAVKMWFA